MFLATPPWDGAVVVPVVDDWFVRNKGLYRADEACKLLKTSIGVDFGLFWRIAVVFVGAVVVVVVVVVAPVVAPLVAPVVALVVVVVVVDDNDEDDNAVVVCYSSRICSEIDESWTDEDFNSSWANEDPS